MFCTRVLFTAIPTAEPAVSADVEIDTSSRMRFLTIPPSTTPKSPIACLPEPEVIVSPLMVCPAPSNTPENTFPVYDEPEREPFPIGVHSPSSVRSEANWKYVPEYLFPEFTSSARFTKSSDDDIRYGLSSVPLPEYADAGSVSATKNAKITADKMAVRRSVFAVLCLVFLFCVMVSWIDVRFF